MGKKYYLLLLLVLVPLVSLTACPTPSATTTPPTTAPSTTSPPQTTEPTTTTPPASTTTLPTTTPPATTPATTVPPTEPPETTEPPEVIMELMSPQFAEGESIPAQFSCDGQNVSPLLVWSGAPEGTESFALMLTDTDAPSGTFTHWIIYNIPAEFSGLNEGVPTTAMVGDDIRQGVNDFGLLGYGGPCPPPGSSHHYSFQLYALDTMLDLGGAPTRSVLINAMLGHILFQANLTGLYP